MQVQRQGKTPSSIVVRAEGNYKGEKYMFRKRGYLSRRQEFSSAGMCSQHTSVPKPEGMTQLHLCYTEDRPASKHHLPKMQGRVWPVHAGPLLSMPRISGGGRTHASNGSPGTYQLMHCVVRKKSGAISQDTEYSQTKTDSEITMSSRKVSKLVPGD